MRSGDFDAVVTTETELRELYRMPADLTMRKKLTALDVHARAFIESAPRDIGVT